jgi:DNA invertase Pin-like site-specific DNA recombinase
LLGAIGQFEREIEIMWERHREGVAKAKAEGKYKGRAPTARAKADDIRRLAAEGLTREAIAKQLAIGVASVYRVLANPIGPDRAKSQAEAVKKNWTAASRNKLMLGGVELGRAS